VSCKAYLKISIKKKKQAYTVCKHDMQNKFRDVHAVQRCACSSKMCMQFRDVHAVQRCACSSEMCMQFRDVHAVHMHNMNSTTAIFMHNTVNCKLFM
jgi:hypothetical protein